LKLLLGKKHFDTSTDSNGTVGMNATYDVDPHYDRGYHKTHYKALGSEPEYYQARAELSLNYWLPEERDLKIFDYGCGLGHGMALLPNAVGWDVSADAREFCHSRKLRVYNSQAEIPRRAYDRVLCSHVLEHLERPLDDLRTMYELLAPGGQLVLVLPVEEHWVPKDHFQPDINQHLYCWTPQTICNLLFRAGYQPLSVKYAYPFGWHALLPVRRYIGVSAYHTAVKVGSQLFKRNGEMIVRAKSRETPISGERKSFKGND
jgi:SAM-dependent methyltransferase